MSITRTSLGASIGGGGGGGGAPASHAASHEDGGADEISVAGLSGALADPQAPSTHGADHVSTGPDAIPAAVAAGASGLLTGADKTKLNGVEALADVTDAANVAAAGALTAAGITTVDATTLSTETSTTYVAIDSMTITPGAGSFLVWFSAMILGSADDEQMIFGIHVNGVLVAASERDLPKGTNKDKNDTALSIHCKVSAGAAETVDVRWKQPSGVQTMQITARTMTAIKV